MTNTKCANCGQAITWDGAYWRDDSDDPGDGNGGDASCGGLPPSGGRMQRHLPESAFDPNRPPRTRAMADGHLARLGHELAGYYVTRDGIEE